MADNMWYSITSIGVFFSKEPVVQENVFRIDLEPQVVNTSENPLTSNEDWILITDTFSSRYGGERYITIGNFNTDSASDTLYQASNNTSGGYSYYYIDDVSVVAIDSIPNSVAEEQVFALSVYPNPAQEFITISSGRGLSGLRLLDLSGRSLRVQPVASDRYTLPLQGIGPGIYLLEATDRTGRVVVQKVVVQ